MWSQCSISLCLNGCLLMSVSVSGSLFSPRIKYTSSCSSTSEVTWRTMRCNSAVDVRIPISELNETFSYQIWRGFPPPKNQLDSDSVLLCLVGATHVCISWGSITSMKNRSRTAFAIATAVVWNKGKNGVSQTQKLGNNRNYLVAEYICIIWTHFKPFVLLWWVDHSSQTKKEMKSMLFSLEKQMHLLCGYRNPS